MIHTKIKNPKSFLEKNEQNVYIFKTIGLRKFEEFHNDTEIQLDKFVCKNKFNINEIITLKTDNEKILLFYCVFDNILHFFQFENEVKNTYILFDGIITLFFKEKIIVIDLLQNLMNEFDFEIKNFKIETVLEYNMKFLQCKENKKITEIETEPILTSPLTKVGQLKIWSRFYLLTENDICVCESKNTKKGVKFNYVIKLQNQKIELNLSEVISLMNNTFYDRIKERVIVVDKLIKN